MESKVIRKREDLDNFIEEFIEKGKRGVIELSVPMLNINEWKQNPQVYALALGLSKEQFENLAYYGTAIVSESDLADYKAGELVKSERVKKYETLPKEEQEKATLLTGAEAIEFMLNNLDVDKKLGKAREREVDIMKKLDPLYDMYDELDKDGAFFELSKKLSEATEDEEGSIGVELTEEERSMHDLDVSIDLLQRELGEVRCLITGLLRIKRHGTEKLVIREINLFPVDMRRIVKEALEKMPYAVYDLEDLYFRIVGRNERLEKLTNLDAPAIILRNEKRVLQEYIDALVCNGARGTYLMGRDERCAATSLTDIVLRNIDFI